MTSDVYRWRTVINLQFTDTDTAGHAGIAHGLMHAVQAANEGGFTAAGRSDNRRGMLGGHVHTDVLKSLGLAEPGVQIFDLDANLGGRCGVQLAPFSIPSVVRLMVGIIIRERATPPASAEKCPWARTTMP